VALPTAPLILSRSAIALPKIEMASCEPAYVVTSTSLRVFEDAVVLLSPDTAVAFSIVIDVFDSRLTLP